MGIKIGIGIDRGLGVEIGLHLGWLVLGYIRREGLGEPGLRVQVKTGSRVEAGWTLILG